ncbi:MAG: HAD-IA family hydrolase [Rickettsiales bacterium]
MKYIDKTIKLETPEVIIFDWDNTLVDAWPLIYKAMVEAFKKYDKEPWSLEETKINVHRALREMLPKLFPNNWQEVGDYYRKVYKKNMELLKPLPNVEKMLKLLNEKDIKVALVSNKKAYLVRKEVELLGWTKYFQSVMGSGDLDVDKPDPKTVVITLEKLSASSAKKVWFVGDSVTDMETAYASESLPVFYGPEDFNNDRFKNCFPKVHISGYKELIAFIQSKYD